MIVYLIQCTINGRYYVGKTTRTLRERWLEHCRDARNFHKAGEFYADIREYGPDAFTVTELSVAYQTRKLNRLEREYIQRYEAAVTGYNKHAAAFGGKPKKRPARRAPTPEQVEKNAATHRALWAQRKASMGVAA